MSKLAPLLCWVAAFLIGAFHCFRELAARFVCNVVLWLVEAAVSGARQSYQVLRPVVPSISVDVVYVFFRAKATAVSLFPYQAMLKNITSLGRRWMLGPKNVDIFVHPKAFDLRAWFRVWLSERIVPPDIELWVTDIPAALERCRLHYVCFATTPTETETVAGIVGRWFSSLTKLAFLLRPFHHGQFQVMAHDETMRLPARDLLPTPTLANRHRSMIHEKRLESNYAVF